MKRLTVLACALLLPAQDPPDSDRDPIERAYAGLLSRLEPRSGPPPLRAEQIAALLAFLEQHGEQRSHRRVLEVRSRLATSYLHAADFTAAEREFRRVLDDAPEQEHDFVARARYGLAQSLELTDDRAGAREMLEEILREHAGLRYARFAKTALARLDDDYRALAGERAPELAPEAIRDVDGKPHALRQYAGRALLLVFWSPDVRVSVERLRAAVEAWRRGGGPRVAALGLALSASPEAVADARRTYRLDVPLLPCTDEFVHPVALNYRVTKVPTVVVIAPDGTIVGRDLGAAALERLAAALR